MSSEKEISGPEDTARIHRDVKKILRTPRGNTRKRALHWNGKNPTQRSPKNFVTVLTPNRLNKRNIKNLFGLSGATEINSEV